MNPASRVRISEDASPFSRSVDYEAQKRMVLVEWINTLIPCACFSVKASNGELRAFLLDGVVLCQILSKLKPNLQTEEAGSRNSLERLKKFLAVITEMGLPGFEISDLEKGSMKPVLDCLYALKEKYMPNFAGSKFTCSPSSPISTESQSGLLHGGHKFNEVFQMKQGIYSDLRVTRISEMVKSNSLDNAPTQSLLSVVNGILDESIERKNTEIPQRVACLLRKVVQEIERRLATQAEHLRIQNNLYKNREEKYQSRISVLETLAAGTNEETEMVMTELQRLKTQTGKKKLEDKKRSEDKEVHLGKKEKDLLESEISALKQELEISKKALEQRRLEPEQKTNNGEDREVAQLKKEKDQTETEISTLKRELEKLKKTYEQNRLEMEQEKNNVDKVIAEMKNDRDQSDPEISRFKQELERAKKMHDQRCHDMEVQRKNIEDEEITRLTKEKDQCNVEISTLKQELEMSRKTHEQSILEMEQQKDNKGKEVAQVKNETHQSDPEISRLKQQLETAKRSYEQRFQDLEQRKSVEENEISQLTKAKDQSDFEILNLKQELEMCKKTYELRCGELETETKSVRSKLEQKLKEQEQLLEDSKHKMKEIRGNAELKCKVWMRKENVFQSFISNHGSALQELRNSSESTKLELVKAQKSYLQELSRIGEKFEGIATTANKYHRVLYENRKIYNELQDLKGNIRVYCRIRPFLPGQTKKDSVIDSIGDNGEVTIINPSKGKDSQKSFKFNKVFAPTSTQEEVFTDTQPLIRTILDGFNVCIFAYGQTGSGKTYTMTGPEGATKEDWGVNYRALDDLFQISEERKSCFHYSIGVQMVEIYNEQILDLLSSDTSQKKLGVLTGSQPNGIAVPDASMHTVQSTSHVIELMSLGHANRTVSSTAMNERSSRSHSVVTIHVQGTDLKSNATTHASLHLVDLAGSERVDRSEVTGDRLREAQHINKSLSALGDVIFALASKSNHVPYRNSKLTQVLQSSLGGRAKTLMFVQLNPDVTSFSETLSTLKFAERVSGVELGAARSNKEGRDVKELMEQVVSLKDMIAKKDEEIERLQLLKDPRSISSPLHSRRSANSLTNYGSHSPTSSIATDQEDYIDRNSDSGSTQLTDNDERLSEVSDGDVSVGTDGDETKETPVSSRPSRNPEGSSDKTRTPRTRVPAATPPSRLSQVKTPVRAITALRKPASGTSSSVTPTSRREISRPSAAATPSPRSAVDRPSPRSAVDRPSPRSAVATPSRRVG